MPTVTIDEYGDLLAETRDDLQLQDADALADVLPAPEGVVAFWLPSWLSEEKPLSPTGQSDQVFVAEFVDDRETAKAWYARQDDGAGGWIPKSIARVYWAAPDADIVSPQASLADSTEGSA